MEQVKLLKSLVIRYIWEVDLRQQPVWRVRLTGALRIAYLVIRDFFDGQINLRAMSLVYTTLLSLVPLLAVSFSVLKGLGADAQLETQLGLFLEPMGERGKEITSTVIQFVENIKAGWLGGIGLALFFYTVISLMQKIETAFNYTWHVTEERSFARRFSDYLSVVLIGPVLIFAAMGLTATIKSSTLFQSLMKVEFLSFLFEWFSLFIPYLFVILAFTVVYIFVPNAKVKITSALVGATVAGILWQTASWLIASVITFDKYVAIYAAFATLFVFIIWLYISWLILLNGASIAFYFQFPDRRLRDHREFQLSNRLKEKLALAIMIEVARQYYQHESPHTLRDLATKLNIAVDTLHPLINSLVEKSLLIRTEHDPVEFVPAYALEKVKLLDILTAVREAEEDEVMNISRLPADSLVDSTFEQYQNAAAQSLGEMSLRDLVATSLQSGEKKPIS